jgi:hypothetical protein
MDHVGLQIVKSYSNHNEYLSNINPYTIVCDRLRVPHPIANEHFRQHVARMHTNSDAIRQIPSIKSTRTNTSIRDRIHVILSVVFIDSNHLPPNLHTSSVIMTLPRSRVRTMDAITKPSNLVR